MLDFQFQPNQFTIAAGEEITFNVANNGAVIHHFILMKLDTTAGPFFDNEDVSNLFWEIELQPGDTVNTTFTAPTERGEYEVVCRTEGDMTAGMTGRLTVIPGNNP